jgi:tRNA (guanine37-N1)-methyltransferase
VGDFVLNGGEVAAMTVIDAVIRLVPGVLGDEQSSVDDSFSPGNRLLEFAQYTRPREYRGHSVPDVLLSGDHGQIARWREEQSYQRTKQKRADLLRTVEDESRDSLGDLADRQTDPKTEGKSGRTKT